MPAEKKKLLILGILAMVILGVGAFSLKGHGPATAPKAAASAGHHRHHNSAESSAPATGTNTGLETTAAKPAPSSGPVNEADGGKPGNMTASAAPAMTPSSAGINGGTVASAPVTEQDFPERDPFDGRKYTPDDTKPAPQTPPPAPKPTTSQPSKSLGRIPPMPVAIDTSGKLPAAGSDKLPGLGDKAPAPKVDDFEYTVSGVITGDRSAAVFVDSKGNQRLISLGGSIDGDATVVGISQSKVTVEVHGKKRTLSVGADTPTEKR